ncbi:MAG: Fe-S cluster assembly protein HesB [Bacteroidota bacterium]|jgi:N-glycosylase/DNA lyase
MTTLSLALPKKFSFQRTVNSHGWYDLPPFKSNEAYDELSAVVMLDRRRSAAIRITGNRHALAVSIVNSISLGPREKKQIRESVRSMLRLDESLEEFYMLCRTEEHLRWVPKLHAGRLLRSPTVFEDVVKMMCTTNCSWSLTKIMVKNLTVKLGTKIGKEYFSFPTPEAIAAKSERWLRKEISCGYRAPYLLELCRRISSNDLELESLRTSDAPTEELYEKLRSIKGIGHYAAGNLLKLLGRYDYLGIDSWVRTRFSAMHTKGRKVSDRAIERHYHRYGRWRGLVCWMESTSDWHQ